MVTLSVVIVAATLTSLVNCYPQQQSSDLRKAVFGSTYDEIVVETQLAVRPKQAAAAGGAGLRTGRARAVFFRPNVTSSGAEIRRVAPSTTSTSTPAPDAPKTTTPSDGLSYAARVVGVENPMAQGKRVRRQWVWPEAPAAPAGVWSAYNPSSPSSGFGGQPSSPSSSPSSPGYSQLPSPGYSPVPSNFIPSSSGLSPLSSGFIPASSVFGANALGQFSSQSTNQKLQVGPAGLLGSFGGSASQSYHLPTGETISFTLSNGFNLGPDGPSASNAFGLSVTDSEGHNKNQIFYG